MTERLGTTTSVTVGPATLVGRMWRVTPLPCWSGDATPGANTYRSRNAGKTRDVRVWLGVRYAEPPVGTRRWKPAVDYDYPAGTYQCDKFGAISHQSYDVENDTNGRPEWGVNIGAAHPAIRDNSPESEDCLFLNIYRSNAGTVPAGGFPVVFWIHGGAHVYRSANEPHERGHRLCTEGLIVVNVEYRLGNFGYYYHEDFESEPDWEGPNFAYTDIKSALRWVKRNIAAFGGNPDRVFVGGSSAGAVNVLNLMEDLDAQDLFYSASVCSGGSHKRPPRDLTTFSMGYGDRYGVFNDSVRAAAPLLRDYSNPTRTLAQAIAQSPSEGQAFRMGLSPSHIMAFSDRRGRIRFSTWLMNTASYTEVGSANVYPFIGNGLDYESPIRAAKAGRFTKPFINSVCEHEANVQPNYPNWGEGETSNWLRLLSVPSFQQWERAAWMPSGWGANEKRRQAYNHTIWHFPAWKIVSESVKHGNPYSYLMLWGFGSGPATHSTDVKFIFGNLEWAAGMSGDEAMVTERMLRMSDGMMRVIRNMAYNGNPNQDAPASTTSFNLFADRPQFVVAAYVTSSPNRWNIAGHTAALGGGSAPVQIVQKSYLSGAWAYYDALYEAAAPAIIVTPPVEPEVAPSITTQPSISGSPIEGSMLTLDVGAASGNPPPLASVQWRNGSADIAGATELTLDTDGRVGQSITARVTWSNGVGTPATATTAAVVVAPNMVWDVDDPTEVPVMPTLPSGYRNFNQMKANTSYTFLYPTWAVGQHSIGVPGNITWHGSGAATIYAQPGAVSTQVGVEGRSWYTGAIQINKPKIGRGKFGAIVHATNNFGVAAFFAYHADMEIDFERTLKDGVIGWSPAVHSRNAAGNKPSSTGRVMNRALWFDRMQKLEAVVHLDKVEFFCDDVLFETITPADIPNYGHTEWYTIPGMDLFLSGEKHGDWAGWGPLTGYVAPRFIRMHIAGILHEPYQEPPVTTLTYVRPGNLVFGESGDYRTPAWNVGPESVGDPSLITWNADKSATLDAINRPDQPNASGRTWYTGSIVTVRNWAKGRFGADVEVPSPSAVAAVFAYENDRKREIDFELTNYLGWAGWSPNLHLPRASGSGKTSAGVGPRILRRAPWAPGITRLSADLRDDRCDFYYQRMNANLTPAGAEVLFETIRPTDFAEAIDWVVDEVNMEIHCEVEHHSTWAGWIDYPPSSMILHSVTPVAALVAATASPMQPQDDSLEPLDSAAQTRNGMDWVFTTTGTGRAGFRTTNPNPNAVAFMKGSGTGTASAKATFPVVVGDEYELELSTQGQVTMAGAGLGWAGYGTGTRRFRFTPTATPHTLNFVGNFAYIVSASVKLTKLT